MDKNLKDFRDQCQEILNKSQDDFEKQLIFISAGALTVSMFFIEKVVKDLSKSHFKWILIVSWSLLGITLVVNLLSHFFAIKFNYKNIEEIDNKVYQREKTLKRNNTIKQINILTITTLISGIILLVIFSSLNI